MKTFFKIFIIILFFTVYSCASVKPKLKMFQELETETVDKINSNFYIDLLDNWFPYAEYHHLVAYAPRELEKEIGEQKLDVFFTIYRDITSAGNIEGVSDNFIKKMDKNFNNFKYKIIKAKHKEYGEYYIFKYKLDLGKEVRTAMSAIFLHKKFTYRFYYSTSNVLFEKYLVDVIEMISSFKIKEPIQIQE